MAFKKCPVTWSLFAVSAAGFTYLMIQEAKKRKKNNKSLLPVCDIIFVLGGPGAGKGTQCQLLNSRLGWSHLSAGDLLRAERKSGGPTADLINGKIASGQIVPATITVGLLQKGMEEEFARNGCTKFLVDGFPRSQGNVSVWEEQMSIHNVKFVLNLVCPESVLEGRLLERGKDSGRVDDTIDVVRKRFRTFQRECQPIVAMYEAKGQVRTVQADRPVETVYKEVAALVA